MSAEINLTSTATKLSYVGHSPTGSSWTITARSWGQLEQAKGACLLVHGLGAHSGWFEAFAQRMIPHDYFLLSYDQVGFGERRGEKFASKQQWLDDLVTSFKYLKQQAGQKPVYLIGNSMGAVVALCSVNQVNPDALVLFSPGFDGHPITFGPIYKANAVIAAVFSPDKDIELPYTVNDITPSQSVRDFLTSDPLRRFTITARMGLELLKLTLDTKKVTKSPCPVLMATAGQEKIVNNKISSQIYKNLSAPVKKELQFKQSWHDMMFDPIINELVEEVTGWLNSVESLKVLQKS